MQTDNRKYIRIQKCHPLSFSIVPDYRTKRKITKDLSLGGVRILVNQYIPLRSTLKMDIEFTDAKRTVTAVGIVQWGRSLFDDEAYEMGIKFIEVNKEDARFLRSYLRGIYSAQKILGMR